MGLREPLLCSRCATPLINPDNGAPIEWVYYALAATAAEQLVKIGWSTDVRGRINKLRRETSMPARQQPILLAAEPGDWKLEQARHLEFQQYRVRYEWFRYEGGLRWHIKQLPDRVDEALNPLQPEPQGVQGSDGPVDY